MLFLDDKNEITAQNVAEVHWLHDVFASSWVDEFRTEVQYNNYTKKPEMRNTGDLLKNSKQ